jgi:L-ascorbate metabolism protein UlaG (beta-lactamase superfamily)
MSESPKSKAQKIRSMVEQVKNRAQGMKSGENNSGVLPSKGWKRRGLQFVGQRILPNIFVRRKGLTRAAEFPVLKDGEIGMTWIGHASFLVQIGGLNVMVDPNWAMWHAIIKRSRHPGLRISDLPHIDLVLVSHAHYDHLHMKSLQRIANDQKILVPTGVGELVRKRRFSEVIEMSDWDVHLHGDVKITFTPTFHWGARFLHDTHRGYGGFMIEYAGRTVFHSGDSAYFDGFTEIGSRFPGIDVAILPIGAYNTASGRDVHMNPEEAIRAFKELNATRMVPMHYGTFPLGREPMHEPLERLRIDADVHGLTDRVVVMEEGLTGVF